MTLSTVLHLGEISFVGVGNNDAAQVQNADSLKKGNLFDKKLKSPTHQIWKGPIRVHYFTCNTWK